MDSFVCCNLPLRRFYGENKAVILDWRFAVREFDENWQDEIADLVLVVPFAYCVHDKTLMNRMKEENHTRYLILVLKYDHIQSCASSFQVVWDKAKLIQSRLAYQKHL